MAQFSDEVEIKLRPDFLGGENGRFLPPDGTILELSFLRDVLRPEDSPDYVEEFLPQRIYIREEMERAFKELINNGSNTATVFSGSPGIGKSVLLFLIVLYRVANRHEKAAYIRRTDATSELVSIFAMEHKGDDIVRIRFNREVARRIDAAAENDKLRGSFEGIRWSSPSIVNAVDGPKSPEFTRFSKMTYGCTSGAGISIKHHMSNSTFNVVMGGWKKEDLASALKAELNLDPTVTDQLSAQYFDLEKFDAVYFVTGGRIRRFRDFYQGEIDTTFADQVVSRISVQQASLSLSHSDCRSTDEHVDSLRTMFRVPGKSTDTVTMHVDSGYLIRALRAKISGEELFNSYKKAEANGDRGGAIKLL